MLLTCIRGIPLAFGTSCSLLAHVVLHSVTCTGGLFLSPTTTFTVLPHVVVPLLLALCGGGGGGTYFRYIVLFCVWLQLLICCVTYIMNIVVAMNIVWRHPRYI